MVVTSGSMAPAFDAGDALLVEPSAAPSTGDIIVFSTRERGSARAHRVVATIDVDGTPYLRTKGDANASPDADLLPSDAVYGSVRASMPFAGRGLALLGDPVFGMLVFILPIVWLALRELIDALALEDMW
jgi:signal peptidase I